MKLFTTKSCPNCPAAKTYLDSKGVDYDIVDAHDNMDEVQKHGLSSVPSLVKGDAVFVGLDEIKQAV